MFLPRRIQDREVALMACGAPEVSFFVQGTPADFTESASQGTRRRKEARVDHCCRAGKFHQSNDADAVKILDRLQCLEGVGRRIGGKLNVIDTAIQKCQNDMDLRMCWIEGLLFASDFNHFPGNRSVHCHGVRPLAATLRRQRHKAARSRIIP